MKPLPPSILSIVALCSSSLATDEKTIEAAQAAQYVGQTVVVHVIDAHPLKSAKSDASGAPADAYAYTAFES